MTCLCPHCRHEVSAEKPCACCGEIFHPNDWNELEISIGDRSVGNEGGAYHFVTPETPIRGRVPQHRIKLIGEYESRISIGGPREHIHIADVDAPLALLFKNKISGNWWALRCSASAPVKINHKFDIDHARLEEGDIISVAGIDILFTGRSLRIGMVDLPPISLQIRDLSVIKGDKTLLDNVSCQIDSGEFVGILGPSGCGKTSLIQQIVGLDHASSGLILANGIPQEQCRGRLQELTAYMPQNVALHEDLTLKEELQCFCRLHGCSFADAEAKLALVGLRQEIDKRIGKLSGGQQRRVGIALGLLRNPQLLVLDEPTAGLDPASETEVMQYLRRLADQGKSVLCATHIMGNLNKFDKILLLSKGLVVFCGTPQEMLDFFHINDPLELYQMLGKGSGKHQYSVAKERSEAFLRGVSSVENAASQIPNRKYPALKGKDEGLSLKEKIKQWLITWGKQFCGYMQRQCFELFSFRHEDHPGLAFFLSGCFIQLILQPVLVALALKYACADKFYFAIDEATLFFFSCVAVFWLGLNNSVRELVKERIPWRCLERLEKVSLVSYLSNKLAWTALLSFIQTALFFILLYVISPVSLVSEETTIIIHASWALFGVLAGVCLLGAWIGLAISAIFKQQSAAVAMLPIVLVPVLFFSTPIIGNGSDLYETKPEDQSNKWNAIAVKIEKIMPCHAPAQYLHLLQSPEDANSNEAPKGDAKQKRIREVHRIFPATGIVYLLCALVLMVTFQYNREKKWNGR